MDDLDQEANQESESDRPTCPKCGSHDIRRSKGEGLFPLLLQMFGRRPFRCRSCRSRFYRFSPSTHHD